jgi:30S ribosomal protein S31
MGKGDKKSKKGKISMGSYGNSRPRSSKIVAKQKEAKATTTTTTKTSKK